MDIPLSAILENKAIITNNAIAEKCRICLRMCCESSTIELLYKITEMSLLLKYCDINVLNGVTNAICKTCVIKLESIIAFKQQCLDSQKFLLNNEPEILDDPFFVEEDIGNSLNGETLKLVKEMNTNFEKHNSSICTSCNKKFSSKRYLERHQKKCFSKNNNFLKGTLEKKASAEISCPKCKQTYTNEDSLKEHFEERHNTVCKICNKKFYNRKGLERHRELHDTDRPKLICEICKKFYNSSRTLESHNKKFHSNCAREKTTCNLCGIAVYGIKKHLKCKHADPNQKRVCSLCEKIFKSEITLRCHVKTYHENANRDNSLCPECGRVFRTSGEVKYHIQRVHSSSSTERNYRCGYCQKMFKSHSHCSAHEKYVHMNVRPHKCEICSKAFSSRSILDNHSRTHTGEKPFGCHLCSRPFAQKVALKTHLKLVHGLETKMAPQSTQS